MKKQAKLLHLKSLMVLVNDEHVQKAVKDKAWLELWKELQTPVAKIVQKTITEFYPLARPSNDLVQDAIFESVLWLITKSGSWSPNRGAAPATWAYRKIAQITMSVVGAEHLTIDIDETSEDGRKRKAELEGELEGSAWGRIKRSEYMGESEVSHPFDLLANLNNKTVSLLLDALQFLVKNGSITNDAATICAERVMGTEYSIIAEYFGKTEVATRKIAERTNFQLKHLNLQLPRYADLIKIPMIANVVNGKASRKSK